MKKIILTLALALSLSANAMKIVTDEIDEFTDKRTLITSWEPICGGKANVRLRLQNDMQFLDLKLYNDGAIVIGEGDHLYFKATDDTKVEFESIGTFSGTLGGAATGIAGSKAWGIEAHYSGDVYWFADHCARLMRVYTTDVYIDKKIAESDGNKLTKLAMMFRGAVNNDGSFKTITCTLTYFKKRRQSKEWEQASEEYVKDALASEVQSKVDAWKSQSNDTYEYDVKISKSK